MSKLIEIIEKLKVLHAQLDNACAETFPLNDSAYSYLAHFRVYLYDILVLIRQHEAETPAHRNMERHTEIWSDAHETEHVQSMNISPEGVEKSYENEHEVDDSAMVSAMLAACDGLEDLEDCMLAALQPIKKHYNADSNCGEFALIKKSDEIVECVARAIFQANAVVGQFEFVSDVHKEHLFKAAKAAIAAMQGDKV